MPQPKIQPPEGALIGTGKDPLGRWPAGHVVHEQPGEDYTDAIERGYLAREDVVSAEAQAKAAALATVHTPDNDGSNRVRTDRPYTAEEAAAIDAANRRRAVERRERRFRPTELHKPGGPRARAL